MRSAKYIRFEIARVGELAETKKDIILKKLKEKADLAAKTGTEFGKLAAERGVKVGKQLKEKSAKAIEEGMEAARKASTSGEKNIEIIKKLAELKSAEIITEKEFQAKKKQLLKRI